MSPSHLCPKSLIDLFELPPKLNYYKKPLFSLSAFTLGITLLKGRCFCIYRLTINKTHLLTFMQKRNTQWQQPMLIPKLFHGPKIASTDASLSHTP